MRFLRLSTAAAFAACAGLALSACSDPGSSDSSSESQASGASPAAGASFDPSSLSTVDSVAALVPQAVKDRGVLRVGSDTSYAPAEYLDSSDGQTPVGYDVDIAESLAKVMGLKGAETHTSDFTGIIPALGTKFDLGISSFTISEDRLKQVNMVSYLNVGSIYAVRAGNPTHFDPDNPCGATIGVQNGTTQYDLAYELQKKCKSEGKAELKVMPHDLQTDVSTKVLGGQYDATMADTPVLAWTIKQSDGRLESVGKEFDAAPEGIAVAKDDMELTKAVQAGLQYLLDQGHLKQMLAAYGAEDIGLTTAEINPDVSQ